LVSALCGSRFGRGVVIPGGVRAAPRTPATEVLAELAALEKHVTADARTLMGTSSFLDRLRGTGPLRPERARVHGALGPVGKASGYSDDARLSRPYDAYAMLAPGGDLSSMEGSPPPISPGPGDPPYGGAPHPPIAPRGDAMARLRVRWDEVDQAFRLIRRALSDFPERTVASPHAPFEPLDGRAVGWAEAPQGEVLYDVTIEDGRIARCQPRSASFHNLVLMHEVFAGDILTDFPFIEASFGLSVAGAAL